MSYGKVFGYLIALGQPDGICFNYGSPLLLISLKLEVLFVSVCLITLLRRSESFHARPPK